MMVKNGEIRQIAIYGKGSIGKSTIACNISIALTELGYKVMQVGCSPKIDSTALLCGGRILEPDILSYYREFGLTEDTIHKTIREGYKGILCAESGGPDPGSGCAGRGVALAMEQLVKFGVYEKYKVDFVIYDAVADVVCGGFGQPMKKGYANEVYIVTSGEMMSAYAANNICRAVSNLANEGANVRVGGLIVNIRGVENEVSLLQDFASKIGVPLMGIIPRSSVIQSAEAKGGTVLELFPESQEGSLYKELANNILKNEEKYLPTPISLENIFELAKKHNVFEV